MHGQTREAEGALVAVRAQRRAALDAVRAETITAQASLVAARDELRFARTLVDASARQRGLAEGRYTTGVGNVIELYDALLTDVSARAGALWQVPRVGRGLAAGDLDNDGRVDLLLVAQDGPLAYFHNRTAAGHALTLRLEGTASHRDAVGARVAVVASGRRQVAWRFGGGSYQSASNPRLHFGLGDADRIEAIDVSWPSGRVDRFGPLAADAGYLLREGQPEPRPLAGFRH